MCTRLSWGSVAFTFRRRDRTSGHDLYGERFEDFQRILAQLKVKDVEREVQAVLDRHPRPFGGGCNNLRCRRNRKESVT